MTNEQEELITRIKDKVRQLKENLSESRRENESLRTEVYNCQEKLAKKTLEFETIKKQYADLQLATTLSGGSTEGKDESAKRINKLVREIDKCIELLND